MNVMNTFTNSMKKFLTLLRFAVASGLVAVACFSLSYAQGGNYPNKVVKVIVPQPPGGSFDFVGRLLADRMGKQMGQSFIVENKPVSGTLIGTDFVTKAAPDSLGGQVDLFF